MGYSPKNNHLTSLNFAYGIKLRNMAPSTAEQKSAALLSTVDIMPQK